MGLPSPTVLPILAAAMLLSACGGTEKRAMPPLVVGVVTVRTQPVPLTTELSGRTVASEEAEVRPQVSGIVMERLFAEGGSVRAGQPLYRIDPRLYAASAEQARAAVRTAEAAVEANRLKAERFRALAQEGGVSRQEAADAQAAYAQSRALVAQNRAALASASVSLGFTRVTAPISGRIGRSGVTRGALVTAGQGDPLAKIQRLNPLFVDIQQSSNDYLALRRALDAGRLASSTGAVPVRIVLADGSIWPIAGRLSFADVDVNAETSTVTLRVTVPNPRGELLPGLFVRARFAQALVPDGILVPQVAVTRTPRGSASVLVAARDGTLSQRDVVAEAAVGSDWLVTSGLRAGEQVVVEGLLRAKPGAKAKVVPAHAPRVADPAVPAAAPSAARP